jgi:hypothetical protein
VSSQLFHVEARPVRCTDETLREWVRQLEGNVAISLSPPLFAEPAAESR